MSLFIRDTSTVPDHGWRYPRIDGTFIVVRNYDIFYTEIVKHYTTNNQPVPSREDVTRWVCEHLSVPCHEGREPFVNNFTRGLPSLFASKGGCCS